MDSNSTESNFTFIYHSENLDLTMKLILSQHIIKVSEKINAVVSFILSLVGLCGNFIVILMFLQKKFRSNPSHILLLCSAVNDSFYLMVHLVEDILKTFVNAYSLEHNQFLNALNFIDKSYLACTLFIYLRSMLRFNSAFIVIAFTLQRLYVVYRPLSLKWKTKRIAWKSVGFILSVSLILNLWVPFFVELHNNEICEIEEEKRGRYFLLSSAYVCLIVVIPSIIICVSNGLIISKTVKKNMRRFKLTQSSLGNLTSETRAVTKRQQPRKIQVNGRNQTDSRQETLGLTNLIARPHYWTTEQLLKKNLELNRKNSSKKITKNLLLVSFSFVLLNFPYLISWVLFYYECLTEPNETILQNYLFTGMQLTEILFVFNYGIKFFILWFTGTLFRNMFKNISNLLYSQLINKYL